MLIAESSERWLSLPSKSMLVLFMFAVEIISLTGVLWIGAVEINDLPCVTIKIILQGLVRRRTGALIKQSSL